MGPHLEVGFLQMGFHKIRSCWSGVGPYSLQCDWYPQNKGKCGHRPTQGEPRVKTGARDVGAAGSQAWGAPFLTAFRGTPALPTPPFQNVGGSALVFKPLCCVRAAPGEEPRGRSTGV